MRIEEEAVGSIPLRLNGQYGSRVNQVCTLLNCIHTLSNSVHYWIVFYTFLLCSLLNWVHCWTVHTFEIGPLLNCAHCWTRNSDPVSLSSALNPSRCSHKSIQSCTNVACETDQRWPVGNEFAHLVLVLTPFPSFRTRVPGRWTRPGLIGKLVSESMKRRKPCQAQFLQLGNNGVIVFRVCK